MRHKEYDREDVLEKAVQLFWQRGYKASSVADLVKATGLNSASMYKEFGGKDGLFEQSLTHYREQRLAARIQGLKDEPNLKGVLAFLENVVEGAMGKTYKGCLMMNHLTQKHSISNAAAGLIDSFCSDIEDLMEGALRNAQEAGDISDTKDPVALASFVMCSLHGLVLYGQRPDRKDHIPKLHGVIVAALSH